MTGSRRPNVVVDHSAPVRLTGARCSGDMRHAESSDLRYPETWHSETELSSRAFGDATGVLRPDSSPIHGSVPRARGWGRRPEQRIDCLLGVIGTTEGSVTAREEKALAGVIEGDVIPRLVMAHRPLAGDGRSAWAVPVRHGNSRMNGAEPDVGLSRAVPVDLDSFTGLVLRNDMTRALAMLERQHAFGVTLEDVCETVLGPAARSLEALAQSDVCDFTDVTLGLSRLQWLLHELERSYPEETPIRGEGHRILLAAVPGERHPFGVAMLSTVFHRAGWDVTDALVVESFEDLIGMVREEAFPLVGLWVSTACRLAGVADGLDALRRTSANPRLGVVLAGPPCADPTWARASLGADALAETAPMAVEHADRLLTVVTEHN